MNRIALLLTCFTICFDSISQELIVSGNHQVEFLTGSLDWVVGNVFTDFSNNNGMLTQLAIEPVQVSEPLGETQTHSLIEFHLFPNPVTHHLHVEVSGSMEKWEYLLMDINGRSLITGVFQEEIQLDLSVFQEGLYMLNVVSIPDLTRHSYKIIKQ